MSRLMLTTVLLASVGCSHPISEDEAVASLGNSATISRDENRPGKPVTTIIFHSTSVSDVKLKALAPFSNLTTLELNAGFNVTDEGVKEIAKLSSLTTLVLGNVPITDSGLQQLAALTNLTTLNLSSSEGQTKFTDAGIAELQKALPNCKITK